MTKMLPTISHCKFRVKQIQTVDGFLKVGKIFVSAANKSFDQLFSEQTRGQS